jgi:hypothetical protein
MLYFDIIQGNNGKIGLLPSTESTEQFLKGLYAQEQKHLALNDAKVRDIDTHKRYFEVIKLFCDNADEATLCSLLKLSTEEYLQLAQNEIPNLVRKQLLVILGYTTTKDAKINVGGYVADVKFIEAKSISFNELDENAFRALHQANKSLIFDLLRGVGWDDRQLKAIFKDFY